MNPLASRKQLLIAESDLNREQAIRELQAITNGVHALAVRARTIGSFTFTTAAVCAGLVSFLRKKSAPAAEQPSWWPAILQGVQLAVPLWRAFRPHRRAQKEN